MRSPRLLLAILAGLLLPGLIGMAFPDLVARLARPMIFYPERLAEREADPAFWGLAQAESVFLDGEGGVRLHGWWIPPSGPAELLPATAAGEACEAVIFFHGNAGNIASRAPIAARLASLGLGVLLMDYRGYGRSDGSPSDEGLYADGRAAYRHVVDVKKVSPDRLVVIGNSLGAAVATSVASELPVARLVLTGAFRSVPSLARSIYWWMPDRAFAWSINRFDSESRLGGVTAPVLVGRGESDRLIPREETRALYDAATDPKRWFEVAGADHNDLWWTGGLWSQLAGFLAGGPC
jgi:pimeloyl-ACP methyl ester carboxylesterase